MSISTEIEDQYGIIFTIKLPNYTRNKLKSQLYKCCAKSLNNILNNTNKLQMYIFDNEFLKNEGCFGLYISNQHQESFLFIINIQDGISFQQINQPECYSLDLVSYASKHYPVRIDVNKLTLMDYKRSVSYAILKTIFHEVGIIKMIYRYDNNNDNITDLYSMPAVCQIFNDQLKFYKITSTEIAQLYNCKPRVLSPCRREESTCGPKYRQCNRNDN